MSLVRVVVRAEVVKPGLLPKHAQGSDSATQFVTDDGLSGDPCRSTGRPAARTKRIYLIRLAIVPPWLVKIRVPSGRWISVTNRLV